METLEELKEAIEFTNADIYDAELEISAQKAIIFYALKDKVDLETRIKELSE